MKILTLHQPWALFVAAGIKQYETRNWGQGVQPGDLAIHAGKRTMIRADKQLIDEVIYELRQQNRSKMADYIADLNNYHYGAIVARCQFITKMMSWNRTNKKHLHLDTIADLEECMGHFEPGRIAWELSEVNMLEAPIPYTGQQGLRELPNITAKKVYGSAVRIVDRYPT